MFTHVSFINGLIRSMDSERQDLSGADSFPTGKKMGSSSEFRSPAESPFTWNTYGDRSAKGKSGSKKESRGNTAAFNEEFTENTLDELFGHDSGRRGAKDSEDAGPKMEDFDSFEEYIEALVSHERESSKGRPKTSGQNPRRRLEHGEEGRMNSNNAPDRVPRKEWTKAAASEKRPRQPQKTDPEPDFPADDDLELFLNSLDNPDFEFSLDSILNENDEQRREHSPIESSEVIATTKEDSKSKKVTVEVKNSKLRPSKVEKAPESSEWSRVSLEQLTVPILKSLLKELGLQVSGKKSELIDRYLASKS